MENNVIFNPINMKRKLLVLLCFLSVSTAVSAQNLDKKSTAFLDWFFNHNKQIQLKPKRNFYVPKLNKYQVAKLETLFVKDKLHHLRQSREDTARFLLLSQRDKKYINQQIEKLHEQNLPRKVLLQLECTEPDTSRNFKLEHLFWEKAYGKGIYGYYAFSTPIFFDEGKYCVFYWSFSCRGLCGYGTISVYRKTKSGWEEYLQLTNWTS